MLDTTTIAYRRRWLTIALLTVCYMFSLIDRHVIALLIEPIRISLDLNDVEIALVTGFSFSLFYTIAGLPMGWLADRMDRRTLVVAGLTLWSVATALSGLSRSLTQLFLCRTTVAVGEASLSPAAYSIIADTFEPSERARAGAVYFMGAAVGPGLALILGGALLGLFERGAQISLPGYGVLEPWQLVLIALALPGLLWAVVVRVLLVDPIRNAAPSPGSSDASTQNTDTALLPALRALAPILLPFFAATALFSLFGNGLLTWAATYFARVHDWSLVEAGGRIGIAITVCGALGAAFAGWLGGRQRADGGDGTLWIMMWLSAFAVPLSMCVTLLPNVWVSLVGISVLIFATIGVASVAPVFAASLASSGIRGRMVAIYMLVVGLVSVGGGPVVVSLLTEYVFHDRAAIGQSIALLGLLTMPATALLFWRAVVVHRRMMRHRP